MHDVLLSCTLFARIMEVCEKCYKALYLDRISGRSTNVSIRLKGYKILRLYLKLSHVCLGDLYYRFPSRNPFPIYLSPDTRIVVVLHISSTDIPNFFYL